MVHPEPLSLPPVPPDAARLGRRWVRPRALLAPALAVVLALLAAPALLPPPEPPAPASSPPPPVTPRRPATARVISATPPPDRPAAPPAAAPDLPPLAAAWRESVVSGQRTRIVDLMRALRSAPDGREQLLRLLDDAHPRVRAYALRELGRRRDPSLRERFQAAAQDPAAPVRENALWALTELDRQD